MLAASEETAFSALYNTNKGTKGGILLVAKLAAEEGDAKEADRGPFAFLDSIGGGDRSKVVGCIGCSITCYRSLTGEEVDPALFDSDSETVLRPVMADLAVSSKCRGRGIAQQLIARLEDLLRERGFEEVTLLVEATNFQARGLYAKLGYRLCGVRPFIATSYLEAGDGGSRIADRQTTAFQLRKSLKPFPWGALENVNWGLFLGVPAAVAATLTLTGSPEEIAGLARQMLPQQPQ